MKLLKSLVGRRQFLIAAGLTSASTLAYKKLAGLVDVQGIVNATEISNTVDIGSGGFKCVVIYFQ